MAERIQQQTKKREKKPNKNTTMKKPKYFFGQWELWPYTNGPNQNLFGEVPLCS